MKNTELVTTENVGEDDTYYDLNLLSILIDLKESVQYEDKEEINHVIMQLFRKLTKNIEQ